MSYERAEEDGKDLLIFIPTEPETPIEKSPQSEQTPSSQSEAYNEQTGEINWDCPCIASMVKPPCGEVFKEAFSCFVYSKEGSLI
jgi:intermembrane space import and assembly protein 40